MATMTATPPGAMMDSTQRAWLKKMGAALEIPIQDAARPEATAPGAPDQPNDDVAQRQSAAVEVALEEWENLVREEGPANRGKRVDVYARNAGFNPNTDRNPNKEGVQGIEWCGAFVGYALTQSGFKDAPNMASYQKARDYFMYRSYTDNSPAKNEKLDQLRADQEATGSTRQYFLLEGSDSDTAKMVKQKGKYGKDKYGHFDPDANTFDYQTLPIQPGDVALFKHGHVGMVKSYDPATGILETLEGNTGGERADGTKAGANAVVQKKYDLTSDKDRKKFDGFGRPAAGDFQGAVPTGDDNGSASTGGGATSRGPASTETKSSSAGKRTVLGGGGYVYEQHADGKIFIVESPKRGKSRIEVKDRKGYDAILAEIGPFPGSPDDTAQTPATGSAPAGGLLDQLFDAVEGAVDRIGDTLRDVVGGAADVVAADAPTQVAGLDDAPEILGGAETETEQKLAEFTKAMSSIVVVVNGENVSVRPPYHINRGDRKADAAKNRTDNPKVNAVIKKVFGGEGGRGATTGKATPEQMRMFLQEAVDQKLVKDTSAKGLRDFLDKYGISTDCSGLAVQALNFLADGDLVRGSEEEIDAGNVGTGSLANYQKVGSPSELQAGDLMVKGGSHVRLITDVDSEDGAVYFTTLESTAGNVSESGDGVGERRWRFPNPSKFSELELQKGDTFKAASSSDSSYIYTRRK